ncbi:MAG: 23S rRNA (adenine(2503)-C(2))-methyltransferase RlmN [Eubacteriales bacterium]|nr:23S rRNA (adenine(2503)-C(2))-methyltransferase RlmN [Eubacteriales bacterium]
MDYSVKELKNILGSDPDELVGVVSELGEKNFRAKQLFGWLSKGVTDFDQMNNIPKSFREKLKERYCIDIPSVIYDQQSRTDGTRKCLFEFRDGSRVESVFMKYSYGNSICISSQVGCRMGCSFCASTRKGLDRSLTAGEIFAQVLAMRNLTGEDINHIVIMGIGEPFDNYENVSKFLQLIHQPEGYNLSYRNITVSTCGLIPGIQRFGNEFPQVNLAVSLHAPNQEIRQKSMPVSRKYGYDELMNACREYTKKTGRRITFEYALIDGLNDSRENALELARHLHGWQTHVNLIPLNKVEGTGYETSHRKSVRRFKETLEEKHIAVTVRRTLGADIDAACGQLRLR